MAKVEIRDDLPSFSNHYSFWEHRLHEQSGEEDETNPPPGDPDRLQRPHPVVVRRALQLHA